MCIGSVVNDDGLRIAQLVVLYENVIKQQAQGLK
jgi:hypothetical protein